MGVRFPLGTSNYKNEIEYSTLLTASRDPKGPCAT